MRNVELKARLADRGRALAICERLGARCEGDLSQCDTYFLVPAGRLKLRDFGDGRAELIFYRRPDTPEAKVSDYQVEAVPPELVDLMRRALGVAAVVEKRRTLFLWENVRIHLDEVTGLGSFIEFEAVVSESDPEPICQERVATLRGEFGIDEVDLLSTSYLEMVLMGARASEITEPIARR